MANQIRMLHLLHQRNSVQLTVYNAKLYKRNENESVQIIFPILSRIYAMLQRNTIILVIVAFANSLVTMCANMNYK